MPGIQGRWEYMRPTVTALSRWFDVRTFSLRRDAMSLDDYVAQLSDVFDEYGLGRAVVCGVSFGGLVALRFAATHPERTRALVLASTPGPDFRLKRRHQLYARLPWIFGPLFLVESPWRLRREVAVALPNRRERWSFRRSMVATLGRAPVSLPAMARRALLMGRDDLVADCTRVTAPTLIVTGEGALDYVVPTDGSAAYGRLIHGARSEVLAGTGHIGTITRPDAFAETVARFTEAHCSRNLQSSIRNSTPDAAA